MNWWQTRTWRRPIFVCVVAFVTYSAPANCNPAPIGSPGRDLVPFSLKKLPGVSISEEILTIKDGMKGKIPAFTPGGGSMDVPSVRYQARYQFDNATGKTVSLKVGFPVIVYSEAAGGSYGGLSELKASYGDDQLSVQQLTVSKPMVFPRERLAPIMRELQSCRVITRVAESADFVDLTRLGASQKAARKVLTNSGSLSQEQVRRVLKVLKNSVYGGSDQALTGQSLVWYTFVIPLASGPSKLLTVSYDSFVPFGGDHSFSYILSTGKFWGHQIKRLKIVIEPDLEFVRKGGRYEIRPLGKFKHDSNDAAFVFEKSNFDPVFDLYVKRLASRSED